MKTQKRKIKICTVCPFVKVFFYLPSGPVARVAEPNDGRQTSVSQVF